jgi:2-polyprenyl-6-methoxyphenol hydroxylase-like FAD-dependent oxidoreductase
MSTSSHPVIPQVQEVVYEHHAVIVVGGGPTGLFTALRLAQAGIDVLVLEAEASVVESPRATTYMPIVCNELEKAGIYKDLESIGHKNKEGISFRTSVAKGDRLLATLKMSQVPKGQNKYDFAGIHAGQHQLAEIILKHCRSLDAFDIRWRHRVVGTHQPNPVGEVELVAVTDQGERLFTCDYLIACDGAGSAVRRSQCIPFEGFTWQDFRFIATNVKYDFEAFPTWTTANMVVDQDDWAVIARTGKPEEGLWRVAYGIPGDVSDSDALKTLEEKYERLFPGPRPLKYELVSANPYWAHQVRR